MGDAAGSEGKARKVLATAPTLMAAAESLAAAGGADPMDVLRDHALDHYAEGLRQYLGVRLGDARAAAVALAQLRAHVSEIPPADMTAPPGIRARLFRMARSIADERAAEARPSAPAPTGTLPWWRPRGSPGAGYSRALDRLRGGELEAGSELLELRFARGLQPKEIAFVLDEPEAGISARLEEAVARARSIVGAEGGGDDLPAALRDAFALERGSTQAAEESRDEEHFIPPGTVMGGRYRIEEQIGAGGFASVYRASDTEVEGHVVALKILHRRAATPEAREAALRELHLIASVFHPSLVQFKDHGWHEGRFWFVMPWYRGESLETRMERKPLSRAEAERIFVPLARALSAMHAAGIRHQDVKPDNIFLARLRSGSAHGAEGPAGTPDDEPGVDGAKRRPGTPDDDPDDDDREVLPVLLDLGVAAKEAELVLAGTPTYFAPEVAAQFALVPTDHSISSASDVFSLALSLRNALEPETREDVIGGVVEPFIEERARHVPDPPMGKDLRYLRPSFARWMSFDPTARPTAGELADELHVLTLPERRRARRMRTLRIALPAVALLAAVGVVVGLQVRDRVQEKEKETQIARDEAELAQAGLAEETERRQQVEERMQEAEQRYQSSKLTRAELATKVAKYETELADAETRNADALRRIRALTKNLDQEQQRSEGLTRDVADQRQRADQAEARQRELDRQLADSRAESQRLTAQVAEARAESERINAQLADLRRQLADQERTAATLREQAAASAQRAADAERELRDSRSQLADTQRRLAAAEQRIAQLERQLAALRARRGGGDANTGAPPVNVGPTDVPPGRQPPVRVQVGP